MAPLALEAQSPGSTSGLGLSPQEDRVNESLNATAATTSTLSTEQREQLSVAQSKARAKIDALERKVAAAEAVGDAAAVEEAKAAMSAAVAVQERAMRTLAAQIDMTNSTPGMHGVLPWRTLQGARLQPAVGKCLPLPNSYAGVASDSSFGFRRRGARGAAAGAWRNHDTIRK